MRPCGGLGCYCAAREAWNVGMSDELSRKEKTAQAIEYRARGHSLRWIARRVGSGRGTVANWLSKPEAAEEVGRLAREVLPDTTADAQLARDYLRSVVEDEQAPARDRAKAAAVLLANHQRSAAVAMVGQPPARVMRPEELLERRRALLARIQLLEEVKRPEEVTDGLD